MQSLLQPAGRSNVCLPVSRENSSLLTLANELGEHDLMSVAGFEYPDGHGGVFFITKSQGDKFRSLISPSY